MAVITPSDNNYLYVEHESHATIRFTDVAPGTEPSPIRDPLTLGAVARSLDTASKVLVSSNVAMEAVLTHTNNGLLDAMRMAYSYHNILELRPDDLWNSIAIAFGIAVAARAEQMRHLFVTHTGKKKIEVNVESLEMTAGNWRKTINLLRNKVSDHITPGIADWLDGGFTTSTKNDKTVTSLALAAGMKNYFDFEIRCACGLAGVNLLGTVGDWDRLLAKVKELRTFGGAFKRWAVMLEEVIGSMVDSRKGSVDTSFWQRIYHVNSYGSGAPDCVGWCIVFSPFTQKGKFIAKRTFVSKTEVSYGNFSKFQPSYAFFPVVLNNSGSKFTAELVVGSFGYTVTNKGDSEDTRDVVLAPVYSWFMHTGTMDKEVVYH